LFLYLIAMTFALVIALIILVGAVLALSWSSRLGVPLEVMLILLSLAISIVPGLPRVELEPDVVFFIFLPPILFYAAYFTSWRDFKANIQPISLLAVGLILFNTALVAIVARWMFPAMPRPVAFILGAMVSPPDASAATSITRKLGVPRRLVTIIEGESLVNDATALVAYRFAIAATLTGVFSLGRATLQFIWVGIGGVAVGYAVGWLALTLLRRVDEVRAQTVISFVAAFSAYLLGELFHVSGVIATVTAGLFFGRCLPLFASAQTRVEAQATWEFVIFVLNAFVFTLIGLQLPTVIRHLAAYPWTQLIKDGAILSSVVILIRFAWVFPAAYLRRWLIPGLLKRDPMPSWQTLTILAWTAMRGIVTLAAALALPTHLPNGEPFPFRDLLIFLAYVVILVTLLLPSFTLPWLLRRLGLHAGDENQRDELLARIAAIEAALRGLDSVGDPTIYPDGALDRVRSRYSRRLDTLRSNLSPQAFSPIVAEDQQMRRLMRDLIKWERGALENLRRGGEIHDEIFHSLARELDIEELRLRSQRL
jgi:Na+/H+ antiporter